MLSCKSITTLLPSRPLQMTAETAFPDPTLYRSIVGGLQYLTFTRPDLSYAVNLVCQYMHAPKESHWQLIKCILYYVHATVAYGLPIQKTSLDAMVAYSDAD